VILPTRSTPNQDQDANPMAKPHHHPAYRTPVPPLDYSSINRMAEADMAVIFDLWHRDGTPCSDVRQLNPDAPADRRLRHFHLTYSPGAMWSDLNGQASGVDLIDTVVYLADVPRDIAASFLRDRLEASARNRRPTGKLG
jgi:hypothetical protein